MKPTKTISLACVLCCLALATLPAQEFGVDSTTNLGLSQKVDFNFSIGEQLALWWKLPIDAAGSSFNGRGHIGGGLSVTSAPGSAQPAADGLLNGDIDSLVLSLVVPKPTAEMARLQLDLGRVYFRDATGLVLNHAADGAAVDFDFKALKVGLKAGYTGLILRNASTIAVSKYDEALAAVPLFGSTPLDPVEITGPRRLLISLGMDFPDLFKQELRLGFLMQQDLNPADRLAARYETALATGGPVNTQYATVSLGGPIVDRLFYSLWFTYGSGDMLTWQADPASATGYSYAGTAISAFLTGFKVDWFVPAVLNSAFGARFIFASGDADATSATEGNAAGDANQFAPLTPAALGTVFAPKLSNLVFAELSGSLKPLEGTPLQAGAKLQGYFRPTLGAVGAAGMNPSSSSNFLGMELDIFGTYRILSDLGVSLNGGLFFPDVTPITGAFLSTVSPVQFALQASLVLGM
jgi:hypothetical protein